MLKVPLSAPDITDHEIDAVVAVLRSERLSLGPRMEEFEAKAAARAVVAHGVAVSSGTAGLHLCVRALGLGAGGEVLVPSFTFIAAANAVRYEGAQPVFVDIDHHTLNMDPAAAERAVTPRTRALMLVHTFGRPAAIGPLLALARRHGLRVIEDACEAIGASSGGAEAGSWGDAGVFAFYPNKQITTGEGGMIVTADAALARELRALRNQGRYPSDDWLQHSTLGWNYRLSELSCALGSAQMDRLEEILLKRERVAGLYAAALAGIPGVELPAPAPPGDRISWFVYVVRVPASARDRVAAMLAAQGIQTGRYFAPIHQQPAYQGSSLAQPLPVTEGESLRTLALPFFSNLGEAEVAYVAEALRQALASIDARSDH